jgi:hypothetical protein
MTKPLYIHVLSQSPEKPAYCITLKSVRLSIKYLLSTENMFNRTGCPCIPVARHLSQTCAPVWTKVHALRKLAWSSAVPQDPIALFHMNRNLQKLTDFLQRAAKEYHRIVLLKCVCNVTSVD